MSHTTAFMRHAEADHVPSGTERAKLKGIKYAEETAAALFDLGRRISTEVFGGKEFKIRCSHLDRALETAAALVGGYEYVRHLRAEMPKVLDDLVRARGLPNDWAWGEDKEDIYHSCGVVDDIEPVFGRIEIVYGMDKTLSLADCMFDGVVVTHEPALESVGFKGFGYAEYRTGPPPRMPERLSPRGFL